MRGTLTRCGLLERFGNRIFSTTEVANGKPALDLVLDATDALGVEPHLCAVVEESAWGVQAGVAAGMDVYAYAGCVTPRGTPSS